MRRLNLAVLLAVSILTVTAMSAMVYARDTVDHSGSMMGGGMMGGGHMMGMGRMMGHRGDMMRGDHGSGRPNEQWRSPAPDHDH